MPGTHANCYLHSSSCQGLVHNLGHRHTWSCRECLHTSVHIHHCLAWHTHHPLKTHTHTSECITNALWKHNQLTQSFSFSHSHTHTFEKVSSKAGLVYSPIWDKLHPQRVWGRAHVLGFVVATESPNQRARFERAVPNFQVIVSAAVVPLDLHQRYAQQKQWDTRNMVLFTKNHGSCLIVSLRRSSFFPLNLSFTENMTFDLTHVESDWVV